MSHPRKRKRMLMAFGLCPTAASTTLMDTISIKTEKINSEATMIKMVFTTHRPNPNKKKEQSTKKKN